MEVSSMSPINDSSNIPEVSSLSSPGVSSISIYPPPSVSFSMAGASSQPRSSGSKNIPAVQTPGSYSLHDSSDSEVEENIPPASASNRPKTYMTNFALYSDKRGNKLDQRQSQTPFSSAFWIQKDFKSKKVLGLEMF